MKLSLTCAVVFLLLPVLTVTAAEKRLSGNEVPAPVALGRVTALARLGGTNQLRVAIGLPLRDAAGLTNLLREIYNPSSPQFHHYLTPQEFAERFGPVPKDYETVVRFAQTNGLNVVGRHANRLVLDVTGGAEAMERAFHVQFHIYRHPRENRNFFAPDTEPQVDATLPILHVSGLDNYSLPHPMTHVQPATATGLATPLGGTGPGGSFWGGDFRQAYVPGTPLAGTGQSVALLQFDGFFPVDITNYVNATGISNPPPVVIVPVDGGVTNIGNGEIEVALDIELAMAMAPGLSNIYVYEATNGAPWDDLLSQMANDNLAQQLSCSWSGGNPDPTADEVFLQMAAQGQTFLCGSGDTDAYSGGIPFPCDNANITLIGGTTLTTDGTGNYLSEQVWNRFNGQGSGGGVSPFVLIPSWQLGLDLTAAGGSASFRNLPDVALIAENVSMFHGNGSSDTVGGTSCGAPLWAGYAALMNQQAAQLGQPPVGFLNPAIYALSRGPHYAGMFHDITNGNNTSTTSPANFFAAPGFDLCTGWGTPNGTNLINALTATPDFLGVSPPEFFVIGAPGGPFSQTSWVITLTNGGAASLDWGLGNLPPWLTAATSGTLPPNGSTQVSLQLNQTAIPPDGVYIIYLNVTNLFSEQVHLVQFTFSVGQSIAENGGFEAGDFTGWVLDGDTLINSSIYNAVVTDTEFIGITNVVHSGFFGAFLGQGGRLASLSQTLATVAGQRYQLSFWLDNPASGNVQQFFANWDDTNVFGLTNPPAFTWTNYQFVVTASAASTVLQFQAENDPGYFGFDDVSVLPVPPVAFGSVVAGNAGLQFNWDSLAGLNYQVQFTTNLAPANWQTLAAVTAGTNVCNLTDTNILSGTGQRFYRLELLP